MVPTNSHVMNGGKRILYRGSFLCAETDFVWLVSGLSGADLILQYAGIEVNLL